MFDFDRNVILENQSVYLSPLKKEHFEVLKPISDAFPELLKYSPSLHLYQNALDQYIEVAILNRQNKRRYPFIIFDKRIGEYVGSTSFGNIYNQHKRLEIGWTWIKKTVQGTGLNTNMKYLMLDYAFQTLQFERVEFKADARNLQSRRAMEKIGAQYEGQLRSHTLMSDGIRRDTVYYGILFNEWEQIKDKYFKDKIS